MKVKVCGMKYTSNIQEIASGYPDYMGFIFYKGSPRYVGKQAIARLQTTIDAVKRVGVFVNEDLSVLNELIVTYNFDCIQLHGTESPEYILSINRKNCLIIKAFNIQDGFDWDSLMAYDTIVDYYLFDTTTEKHGGSGKKFDWGLLKNYRMEKPFFLSGGISIEDTANLKKLNFPQLYAVDINSCFEISPGFKNEKLVNRFLNKIRDEELPS